MGGRPRTPTHILEASGAFRKNPARGRARANEPVVVEPLGDPPDVLSADQQAAWLEIVDQCPAGVLTKADRIAVENAARLLVRERLGVNSVAQGRRLDAFLGRFGMTPADRSRVSVTPGIRRPAATSKPGPVPKAMKNPFEALG